MECGAVHCHRGPGGGGRGGGAGFAKREGEVDKTPGRQRETETCGL